MMMTDDPEFYAWLDGELDEAAAAAMAARVAGELELSRMAEQHRGLGATLRGAFDPIAAAPVPAGLVEASRVRGEVIDFAAAGEKRRGWNSGNWAAMAASLVVGLLVGRVNFVDSSAPVSVAGGRLVAASALKDALTGGLASAPAANGPRIALSFRDRNGSICRSFVAGAASGLACHEGEQWRLRGLFQAPEGQSGAYRMASGPDPALAALVDSEIVGEPMDAAGEAKAKAKGWR